LIVLKGSKAGMMAWRTSTGILSSDTVRLTHRLVKSHKFHLFETRASPAPESDLLGAQSDDVGGDLGVNARLLDIAAVRRSRGKTSRISGPILSDLKPEIFRSF
jgi:hypothetical protein